MPELAIIEVQCKQDLSEILMAEMSEFGYESFQETETGFISSISFSNYSHEMLENLFSRYKEQGIQWMKSDAAQENWNKKWEKNYPPVEIEDQIIVKAPFHEISKTFKYELIIMPKMSFGTGHHETTELMLRQMLDCDFNKKSVLDAGCGTGVLGIMAAKLGASNIVANDIEEWAFENAIENYQLNGKEANILLGSIDVLPKDSYDFILANINKNTLLNHLEFYAQHLNSHGKILLSGFYQGEINELTKVAFKFDLKKEGESSKSNWALLILAKKN